MGDMGMEKYYYEKEFLKRIKRLNAIRRKAHPNEYPIIDDTIRTMEIIIADAKRPKKKNKPFKSNVKLSNKEKDIWNLNQRALEIEVEKRLQKKNNKN